MSSLLIAALAAYVVAAIHSILAFVNKRRTLERMSLGAVVCGFVIHTIALVGEWLEGGQYPLFYLRETISFFAWALVISYGLAWAKYRALALGSFILPLVALLSFIACVIGDGTQGLPNQVTSGKASWLFPIHTTLLFFAYASFFVVFAASVMYLILERELKLKTFSAFFHRLPSLATVDSICSSAALIGFTLLTLGILSGMLWSSARGGMIWHNDPKEIFAALTWGLYFALVYYRYTSYWRGRRVAWMGIAGFALVLCTFLGTRLMGGYHVFG